MSTPAEPRNKRVYLWLVLLVGAIGFYVVVYTDLLRPPPIEVVADDLRVLRPDETYPFPLVVFGLDDRVRLDAVRVTKLDPAGGDERVVWDLVGDPRSIALDTFVYGATLSGLSPRPNPENNTPVFERLTPSCTYRLDLRSGRRRGSVTFET